MTTLQDKVVAVTGASRGLGRRMAEDLVAAGARVALLARPSEALREAAEALGDRALAVPVDVASFPSVEAAMNQAAERLGGLNVLVNNAALYHPLRVETSPTELIEAHVTTNLLGPLWCVRAALPHLRAAGGGDVVNVSSVAARTPRRLLSVYGATKGGLESLSIGLRNELRGDRIRVTVLRIGAMAGGTGGADWDPEVREEFYEAVRASGGPTGAPVSAATLSGILIHLLGLPPEVNIDMVDARPF